MLVDSLAQAYGWPLDQIMSLTLPQLILLNESADINRRRSEERYEWEKKRDDKRKKRQEEEDAKNPYIEEFGKRLDELNSDEQARYFSGAMRSARKLS